MNAMQQVPNATPVRQHVPLIGRVESDLEEAISFLDLLEPNGQFTFQTFHDKKDAPQKSSLIRVLHGTLDEHSTTLVLLNQQGAGIFVMVNEGDGTVHAGNKTCRTAKNVIRVRAAFVDLDGAPLAPVLKAKVMPSIIVESSTGRWHAYWPVHDFPLDQFKPVQIALAAKFAGDPTVNDLCRVMRLPGFLHQKNEPFMTRLVGSNELQGD